MFLLEEILERRIDDVAGHEDNAPGIIRPAGANPIINLAAVHAGHLQVAADGVHRLILEDAEGGFAMVGSNDRIPSSVRRQPIK